eukprot:GHRQ01013426.1.p4 GENE.GHRQ01013426.1~~GHRQ01013426.1.p4  ORF type:complete len:104 (+),score=44.13 GHRQ01013426.1:555-866(+)
MPAGMRWLAPGQQQLDPIELPITWSRLPPETELRVAVRILPKFNTRVAPQAGQVAAVVFGTPPGRCPPGEPLLTLAGSAAAAAAAISAIGCTGSACFRKRALW